MGSWRAPQGTTLSAMKEDEARQVLLLQSREAGGASAAWSADDRAWATRQAIETLGAPCAPDRFVATRAAFALQRLLPRDAAAQRWLARRAWHPAWTLLALVLGLVFGLAVDQLGPPQRVNLLAPAVWAVVAWNLAVYAALLLPLPSLGLRRWLAGWGLRGDEGPTLLWARHAAPLNAARAALVLHAAAAALGLGLICGLYLRGLVLDYRAGWQSTFLDSAAVQTLLTTLLAPASALTGLAVPDVVPLRVGPGAEASASAARWIHLFAATLALFVVLPRALLALRAGFVSRRLSQYFPIALDTPYFEALHPLMRPGLARAVRLLWAAPAAIEATLFGHAIGHLDAPLTLLRSDEGDELQLDPLPTDLEATSPAPEGGTPTWWQRWRAVGDPAEQGLARLRTATDAVLFVTAPNTPRPAWLAVLARPVIVLFDAPTPATAPPLCLRALADGWLAEGRLLHALSAALEGDLRWQRLADAWTRRQQARFDAGIAEVATSLGRIASARAPVAGSGWRFWRSEAEADTARASLATALEVELLASGERLGRLIGVETTGAPSTPLFPAALRSGIGEGRAALTGGVLSGALLGLKADLLSGGLTMGGGMLVGAVLGALGGAGVARGLNVVRDTDRAYVTWDEAALAPITEAVMLRYLMGAHGLSESVARERLAAALVPRQEALSALWHGRSARFDNAGAADALAAALQPVLAAVVKAALAPDQPLAA